MVKKILQLATEIKLRDRTSQSIAKDWTHRTDISLSGDPAKEYINKIKGKIINDKKRQISCFLREWTPEYARNLSDSEFHRQKETIETAISDTIRFMRNKLNIEIVKLYHMHNFHIGGDDRDFSRKFIKTYFNGCDYITYDEKLSTVESILSVMNNSEFNLCMRFHSVLFAHTLDVNFMAIDYTFGGKVYKYLDDNNSLYRLVKIEPMIPIISNNEFGQMKVLHIATSPRGGAGKAAVRLHEALIKKGVDSKMLVLYHSSGIPSCFTYRAHSFKEKISNKFKKLQKLSFFRPDLKFRRVIDTLPQSYEIATYHKNSLRCN